MDFQYNEMAELLREKIRKFVKENLPQNRERGMFSEEHDDEDWAFSMKMSKKLSDIGWLTMSWPKEYSGMGASIWERCTVLTVILWNS